MCPHRLKTKYPFHFPQSVNNHNNRRSYSNNPLKLAFDTASFLFLPTITSIMGRSFIWLDNCRREQRLHDAIYLSFVGKNVVITELFFTQYLYGLITTSFTFCPNATNAQYTPWSNSTSHYLIVLKRRVFLD